MSPSSVHAAAPVQHASTGTMLDRFSYDDDIVRKFLFATLLWGVVGMLVGLVIALQLANPIFNFNTSWLSFGRLRPLHTNAVIFAFGGCGRREGGSLEHKGLVPVSRSEP